MEKSKVNKNIVELLILLRNSIKNGILTLMHNGMCIHISYLKNENKINLEEEYRLSEYLKEHNPIFTNHPTNHQKKPKNGYSAYWWSPEQKQPRLNWLSRRIKIEKMKQNFFHE